MKRTNTNQMKMGVGLLVIMCAFMIPAVAADSGNINVKSTVSPSFSMVITPPVGGDLIFPLTIVGENKASGGTITVTTNAPYHIMAKDSLGYGGHMKAIHSTGAPYDPVISLTNPIQASLNDVTYTAITNADQAVRTVANGETFTAPLYLKQVTVFQDAPLAAGDWYHIQILLTGSST